MQFSYKKYNTVPKAMGLIGLLCLFAYCSILRASVPTAALPSPIAGVESAFILNVFHRQAELHVEWYIAPGCYLYQNKLKLLLLNKTETIALLKDHPLPAPHLIQDPYFGTQAIYQNALNLILPLSPYLKPNENAQYNLQIEYQGCAQSGFCYPPVAKWFEITIKKGHIIRVLPRAQAPVAPQMTPPTFNKTLPFTQAQNKNANFLAIFTFYLLGILLSFTPCVLPMIPILFGVIVGQKHLNTRKAFFISLCYVLSMALTYAGAGVLVALLGKNYQAALQQPIVILLFSLFFCVLALTQIGVIRFTLPAHLSIKDLLTRLHTKQKSGTYIGAAIMGFLATLIASPCVTAPLIGALGYISQSGNLLLGGSALLALGLGMGTILLLIGTFGAQCIPTSGPWMHAVNHAFSIIMFGLSLWLLDRAFHGPWVLAGWGILCFYTAWAMNAFSHHKGWSGKLGFVVALYGVVLLWGATLKQADPLTPLLHNPWHTGKQERHIAPFKTITTPADLEKVLLQSRVQHRPVMLVFYAKWCVLCEHLEKHLFESPRVIQALAEWDWIRADVTQYNQATQALLKQYALFGPPCILFFDEAGNELKDKRIVGEISTTRFLNTLPPIIKGTTRKQQEVE